MSYFASLLLELVLVRALGEAIGRWLFRTSLFGARKPELAFLAGMAGLSVSEYVALAMSYSFVAVIPTVLVIGLGLYLYRPAEQPVLPVWRTTPALMSFVAVGAILAGFFSQPDPHTISLAAFGFPLRDPADPYRYLIGPLGPMIVGATLTRFLPSWTAAILAIDAGLQFAFFGLSISLLSRRLFIVLPAMAAGFLFPPLWLAVGAWLQAVRWIPLRNAGAAGLMVLCGALSRTDISLVGVVALLAWAVVRRDRRLPLAAATLAAAAVCIVHISVLRGEAAEMPDLSWLRQSFQSTLRLPRRVALPLETRQLRDWIADAGIPLWKRVARFEPREGTWLPALEALRTGTRIGQAELDPTPGWLPIGKPDAEPPQGILAGVWANDFVLLPAVGMDAAVAQCGAPERWHGASMTLREVTDECRQRLFSAPVATAIDMADRRTRLPLALARLGDPVKLPPELLAMVVIREPIRMFQLRHAVDALWTQGRLEDARRALGPVVAAHPELSEAQYSMAYTLHLSGRFRDAIPYYDRALRLGYDEFWVRFNRGAALVEAGDRARARADLERAVQLNPAHPTPKQLLAKLGASR